ncbi:MAG: nicotinate (nicotinamide) nucleotide adenylyltransferase [Butyricicoccus sp.]|nr:nicotinate (nicotinamide) nucleotide adenylyltransferase [Butyricicoccus sp.]
MKICVYGGSFNPPHIGHLAAAKAAMEQLAPEKMLVIPDRAAPHKDMAEGSPAPEQRLELARLTFAEVPGIEVSDMELRREGKSFTSDTLRELLEQYPGAELYLLVGTDMLCSFEKWRDFEWILQNAALAAMARDTGEGEKLSAAARSLREKYGARVEIISAPAVPASSTQLRELLRQRRGRELMHPAAYAEVIRQRLYGAQPEWEWLREQADAMLDPKRVRHVRGVESEARSLARRWGTDPDLAAEAGILHDITKKLDLNQQLLLCEEYGIITDELERTNEKLLHAKTGAAVARDRFGACDEVYTAIEWHTTGRPDMSMPEKVLYMADYIEPARDFEGVERLRALAYEDIDAAMELGLRMSLEDIVSRGNTPHEDSASALEWYAKITHRE